MREKLFLFDVLLIFLILIVMGNICYMGESLKPLWIIFLDFIRPFIIIASMVITILIMAVIVLIFVKLFKIKI